jgi:O-antigen/teichoic acid export membrane protein
MAYAQYSADKILVGRFLGTAALGTYSFAYNLMFMPIMNIGYPLQQVLFPALASIQDDEERLRAAWLRGKQLAVAVLVPAFLLVVVVAPDLVPLVFGNAWKQAVPVLQLLCFAGVAYSLGTLNWNLLLVRNRPRALLQLTILITSVVLLSVVVGLTWGVVGVAACYAGAHWLLVLPETWLTTRAGGVGFMTTLRAASAALPFAAAAAILGYGARLALLETGVPPAVRIVAATVTLLVAYAGLVRVGSRTLWSEARDVVVQRRRDGSRRT